VSDKENQASPPKRKIAKRSNGSFSAGSPQEPLSDATNEKHVTTSTKALKKSNVASSGKKKSTQADSADAKADAKRATEGKKAYTALVKAVTKQFTAMLKKQKVPPRGGRCPITADDYADAMAGHLPEVDKILELSPKHAFLAILYLADHAYGDIESCAKSAGYGDTEPAFQEMDALLYKTINARLVVDPPRFDVEGDPGKKKLRYGGELAAYRRLLGRYPRNKREFLEVKKLRRADLRDRNEKMRERREVALDWISNSLEDIAETKKAINPYGIGLEFFKKSIKEMEEYRDLEYAAQGYTTQEE